MSRPTSQVQRPLSLTEELEKLEQSITLTLQEIDQNFSQAHRIVTTSILPLVEQYTEHSRDVWEGSKFWKQFFEASANVSLSGYEERNNDEETEQEPTATEEELSTDMTQNSSLDETITNETPSSQRHETPRRDQAEDLDLTDLAISSHSTPRAPGYTHHDDDDITTSSMDYSSSYENLRKQVNESEAPFDLPDSSNLPSTPGRESFLHRGVSASTPMSSPFLPPASQPSTQDRRYQKTSDPVLHQMLDKTYRVQATPLGKGFRNASGGTNPRSKFNVTPQKIETTSKYGYDDSPISSPEPEAPQLHSEIFSSPIKGVDTPGTNRKRRTSSNRREPPRPGMSVLTPAKKPSGKSAMWDSDDDFDYDDEDLGPSPPKTMQFHIPQSRLMRTPAREASKRIVTDLLATAGAGDVTDDFGDEQSPSVIRRMENLEDETF
ncbi:unnamed protein product [Penicillium salamii]|uniref:DASH complex subunit ASK1 n=1 Tax=Penicillium salamii TaxID=1612424 RepID=A0A9W4JVL3_9EURO|nr:unnamed protein product [Penicillium salamii]CAG8097214.1 unnamed protein product [Penicillium salamii]CAG8101476.1 unnamed protein product [Penicillium salamii]CAG8102156.1 unnamed protein product [Penicillium salamii]CAG8168425.1 unnamed protein product [Penicillium salamii]